MIVMRSGDVSPMSDEETITVLGQIGLNSVSTTIKISHKGAASVLI